jgi:glutathione S-transferase
MLELCHSINSACAQKARTALAEKGAPYILRLELLKLANLWDRRRGVAQWWERMRQRPSTEATLLARMTVADHAPFKTLEPDPWPKVRALLDAA